MRKVPMHRLTSNASLDTHETTYFKRGMNALYSAMFTLSPSGVDGPGLRICDPFARNCRIAGEYTNDIDPDTEARHHLDAVDFLASLESGFFDGVIFDPPFTEGQAARYEVGHQNIYTTPHYIREAMGEIERILKPGGYLLKFGYNTTRHRSTFDLVEVWCANLGGNHNDTLVSLWRKGSHTLEDWG